MKKFKWWVMRVGSSVMEWTLAYWALVQGTAGAGNVLVFLIWLVLILTVVSYCYVQEAAGPGSKYPITAMAQFKNYPLWFLWMVDFPMVLVLAWHGWWTTAIALMVYLLIFSILVQEVESAYAKHEAA